MPQHSASNLSAAIALVRTALIRLVLFCAPNCPQVPLADDEAGATACEQWVVCPLTAPAVPDGFKLMASEHLPISTYHFYEQFLSVETTCLQDHHTSTGQYNFTASRCVSWRAVTAHAAALPGQSKPAECSKVAAGHALCLAG